MLHNPYNVSNPDVMIVGEYASSGELKANESFNGTTGKYLIESLQRSGFEPTSILYHPLLPSSPPRGDMESLFLNKTEARRQGVGEVAGAYPKPELVEARSIVQNLIATYKPKLILSLGNVPMWAVNGTRGSAVTWNGSMHSYRGANFMPIISPITVQRMWSFNPLFQHALKKASLYQDQLWREPHYRFILQPTYTQTITKLYEIIKDLEDHQVLISCDIETRERHIACLGLGFSELDAICIPFMKAELPCAYWSPEEEYNIILLLKIILTHPNALVCGQNFEYDRQYIIRYWGFKPNLSFDTMTLHHTWQPDLRKGLDTLAFLYCDFYRYWKEESKDWDPRIGEIQLWRYNCHDCVATWEIANKLRAKSISSDPFYIFQHDMHEPVLDMILRGTKCDVEKKLQMTEDVKLGMQARAEWFEYIVGPKVFATKTAKNWWTSPQQTMKLFYDVMKIPPVMAKRGRKHTPTSDDKALKVISNRDPLASKLCQVLQEYRSLAVFHNTFLTMELDWDKRIRCQYMVDGTKTFRFASMEDAFHYGTNLQNIPKGN
jgi:uracil-DNA glycosylase